MSIPDLINGAFELTGGVICWLNVRRLLRDGRVQGVDWRVNAFFSSWGWWNLFYYPSLHQWASFAGGLALVVANTTWVVLALRTIRYQKWIASFETVRLHRHMRHKAFDPTCEFCQKAIWDSGTKILKDLPEIKHTYKCECDLCQDTGNIS